MRTRFQNDTPSQRFRGRLGRRMLLLLLPLIIAPVLLMGYTAYQRAQTLLLEQAEEQIDTLEDTLRANFDTWLLIKSVRLDRALRRLEARQALDYLLTHPRFSPQFADARQRLLEALNTINATETTPIFNDYYLVVDGKVVVATRPEQEGLSLDQEPLASLLQTLGTEEGTTLHRLFSHTSPLTDFPTLVTIRRVQAQGKAGILLGMSYGFSLEKIVETGESALPEAHAFLVTSDESWLYLDPYTRRLTAAPLPDPVATVFQSLLNTPSPYPDVTIELESEDTQLLGVLTVFRSTQSGLFTAQPREVVLAQINSLVPFTIFLLAVTTGFLAMVILGVTRTITRPVLEMAQTAEHFAQGDLRIRFPLRRNDELGILAHAFNRMADQLSELYRRLEFKVEERTQQVRTAAEVAALATSATNLDEILRRTVALIVERFPKYYHASVFLLDETGEFAVLRESTGPVGEEMKRRGHRLQVGGQSLVGWATAHNQPRIASDVTEDPIHFRNPLLPETRSEAAIPIAIGPRVLGALDVQSKDPHAFDEEAITTLQTLARQLAAAIYTATLLETTRFDLEATQTLYQATRRIAQAETVDEVFQHLQTALQHSGLQVALFFQPEEGAHLEVVFAQPEAALSGLTSAILPNLFPSREPRLLNRAAFSRLPQPLPTLLQTWRSHTVALIPIRRAERPVGLLLLGAPQERPLTHQRLQPYINLAEVVSNTLTKIHALNRAQLRLAELEALNRLSQAMSQADHLDALYPALARELRRLYGEVTVALVQYDPMRQQFRVPFVWEQGAEAPRAIPEPIPLGEGLTSLLLKKQEPLLVTRSEEIEQLGAKHVGPPAKSWMGAPLIVGDEILGALLVQDLEHEGRFSHEDFQTFITLSTQVALTIRNIRLLELSQRRAQQQQRLLELGERLRRTIDLPAILETAAQELRQTFQARRVMVRFYGLPTQDESEPSNGHNGHKE